jgi:GNAT superfamily N-acetyltransferase
MSYTSRPLGTAADSIGAYSALLGVTSAPTPPDYLRWLYADNPLGPAVGMNAYADAELVAHYATIPVEAMLDGRPAKGLLSLNTATHPTHQGKGLFTRLAEETYARGAERGYEFVVGVANANSTPGFTKKLGFQLVSPLDVLVGLGRCEASTADVGFSLVWSDASLRWRLARPHARYFSRTRGEHVDIFADAQKAGILAYMATVPASLAGDIPAAPRTRPMRMWIGIDPKLGKHGVLAPLPDRLKPSPLNLIFRDLSGGTRTLSRDNLRFTLLDFDAY